MVTMAAVPIHRWPAKLQFIFTGASGYGLRLAILWLAISLGGLPVGVGTAVMLVITYVYNYALNRYMTWRHREVGWTSLVKFVGTRGLVAIGEFLAITALVSHQFTVHLGGWNVTILDSLQASTVCVGGSTIVNWLGADRYVFRPGFVPAWVRRLGRLGFWWWRFPFGLGWQLAGWTLNVLGIVPAYAGRHRRPRSNPSYRPRRLWSETSAATVPAGLKSGPEPEPPSRWHWPSWRPNPAWVVFLVRHALIGLGLQDPAPVAVVLPNPAPAEPSAPPPAIRPAPPALEPERPPWWQRLRWLKYMGRGFKLAAITAVLGGTGAGLVLAPRPTLVVSVAVYTLPLLVVSGRSLLRTVYRWRTPWSADLTQFRITEFPTPVTTFDFIVPARKEKILFENLKRILQLAEHYPPQLFRIYVAIADDDPETAALARRAADLVMDTVPGGLIKIVTVKGDVHSKPVSLNQALPRLKHEWQITLDAETVPSLGLLKYIDALTQANPTVGVWQLPVQLMNIRGRTRRGINGERYSRLHPLAWGSQLFGWWQGHNALEYFLWFNSSQRHQVDRGYLTFGGNTIAIRRDLLDAVGGWPETLTEDAALGMRLSRLMHRLGLRIETYYLPELASQEQTPLTLRKWRKQRERWLQGFMEVKRMGDWRGLPTWKQRLLAWETRSMPVFQAVSGVMVPVSLATVWAFKAPMLLVMWTYLPAIFTNVYTLVLVVGLRAFCRAYHQRTGLPYIGRFMLTVPLYQFALSIAALGAAIRFVRNKTDWIVTEKDDLHLSTLSTTEGMAAGELEPVP